MNGSLDRGTGYEENRLERDSWAAGRVVWIGVGEPGSAKRKCGVLRFTISAPAIQRVKDESVVQTEKKG